jgi:hypothetical protein
VNERRLSYCGWLAWTELGVRLRRYGATGSSAPFASFHSLRTHHSPRPRAATERCWASRRLAMSEAGAKGVAESNGAEEGIRTPTPLRAPAPQASEIGMHTGSDADCIDGS